MGLIQELVGTFFGSGRNALRETIEVFRPNAEAAAQRSAEGQAGARAQMAAEFGRSRNWFDICIDGLNRLPRPALAIGTIALFVSAMVDPIWFAERMTGLALVPEPLWWLMGAIVTFYFGARQQAKGQEFQRSIAETLTRTPAVVKGIEQLQQLRGPHSPGAAATGTDTAAHEAATQPDDNPALDAWRQADRP